MIFRVGAERSRRRSVHMVHDCGENREGNNPENSGVKGIRCDSIADCPPGWAFRDDLDNFDELMGNTYSILGESF
ncbi:MAG: hypothetical protein U1E78_07655 [Gammaproteobacteria bacterium]